MEFGSGADQLTYEDVAKVSKALKQKEFGELFKSYLDEISDPTHRKEYEQYLSDLEKKGEMPRGKKLVRARSGVCMSSNLLFKNGQKQKIYLNLCQTTEIDIFSLGEDSSLSLPHVLSPPRVDREEPVDSRTCLTADLAVHPQTLNACMRDKRMLKILLDVAADSLTKNFFRGHESVSRDFRLEKFPCKGGSPMPMSVNTSDAPLPGASSEDVASVSPADVKKMQDHASASAAAAVAQQANDDSHLDASPAATTEISFRIIDSESVEIGSNSKSVKIVFACPNISSAKDLDLDVSSSTVSLKAKSASSSQPPVVVDLSRRFPSGIDTEKVKAKFDKTKQQLTLELPTQVAALPSSPAPQSPLPLETAQPGDADSPVPAVTAVVDTPQPPPLLEASEVSPVAALEAPQPPSVEPRPSVEAVVAEAATAADAAPVCAEKEVVQTELARQNRQNVFFRANVGRRETKTEIKTDKSGVVVRMEGTREWTVAMASGYFIDKRQVHVSQDGENMWLVCRKASEGEWKKLYDTEKTEIAWNELEEKETMEEEGEKKEEEEDMSGLESYCHAIRLNYPWLYALF